MNDVKFRCNRGRLVALLLAILGFAMLGGPAQAADNNTLQVASYLDQPVTSQGQVFRQNTIYINKTGNTIVVSGSADGSAEFYVDDLLQVKVTHPDGTTGSTQIDDSAGCTADHVITTPATNIAAYLQTGLNKVEITFRDACGGDYGNSDIYVSGTATFPGPNPPLPTLDGGTFIGLSHVSGSAELCTNAFNVIRPNGQRFTLTAKHCIDGNDPNFDQRTNVQVAAHQPMNVTTVNVGSKTPLSNTLRIATAMDCTPPRSPISPASSAPIVVGTVTSPGGNCVLPSDNPKPANGDMVALKPDPATSVSSNVQTGKGVLPVRGLATIQQVKDANAVICHYGAGSLATFNQAEQCGRLASGSADAAGIYFIEAKGHDGDSGGPAYVYIYNRQGTATGVYGVGLIQNSGSVCQYRICHDRTGFLPLSQVFTQLGVRLATA